MKDDKVDEFFKDNGIDATKEDIVKMAKEAAVENGELSDDEMSKAAGGNSVGSWIARSVLGLGLGCAASGLLIAMDDPCGFAG